MATAVDSHGTELEVRDTVQDEDGTLALVVGLRRDGKVLLRNKATRELIQVGPTLMCISSWVKQPDAEKKP